MATQQQPVRTGTSAAPAATGAAATGAAPAKAAEVKKDSATDKKKDTTTDMTPQPTTYSGVHSFLAHGSKFIVDTKYGPLKPLGRGAYGVVV